MGFARAVLLLLICLPGSAAPQQSYPDTEQGLRSFLADAAKIRKDKSQNWRNFVESTTIPDFPTWLGMVFGNEESKPLISAYQMESEKNSPRMEQREESLAELSQQETGPLKIEKFSLPADAEGERQIQAALASMRVPTSIYRARVPNKKQGYADTKALFFHVGGSFRWMNEISLTALQSVPAVRVRVGGKTQQDALVHQVQPIYPNDAKAALVQGTVRLSLILNRDGSVGQIEVVSGPALLQDAALQAVKQWRYKPTLLNGVAVEVATIVDVLFTLRP